MMPFIEGKDIKLSSSLYNWHLQSLLTKQTHEQMEGRGANKQTNKRSNEEGKNETNERMKGANTTKIE